MSASETKVPAVIITPRCETQTTEQTKSEIHTAFIKNNWRIGVRGSKTGDNGILKVKCQTKKDAKCFMEKISAEFEDKYEVKMEKLQKPRLKIVGIQNKYECEELKSLILNLNFEGMSNIEGEIDVKYIKYLEQKNLYTAYIEVSPNLYYQIMGTRKRLYIGLQSCRVYNDLNIRRCWKCAMYGHYGGSCENVEYCQICAGKHNTRNCKEKENLCCINCMDVNDQYGHRRDIHHMASNEKVCETFKDRRRYIISKTDYPSGKIIE